MQSLGEAIEQKSDFAAARYDRACALLQLHDPAAAVADLDIVIASSPRHLDARLQRARCVRKTSPEQAIEDLTVVIDADPQHVVALQLRGAALSSIGRFEQATADLDQACSLQPENAESRLERGRMLRLAGKLTEAVSELNAAVAIDPRNADILCELALTAHSSGQMKQSRQLLLEALQIQPVHTESRMALADDMAGSNDHLAAIAELQKLLDQPEIGLPANAELLTRIRLRRANWLQAVGQLPAALAELRAVLQSEPHNEQARLLHVRLLQQLQRHDEAIADLTQLISRRRSDPDLLLARASSNAAMRQPSAALQDLNELLNASPQSLPALALRANLLAESGRSEAAIKDLDAAIAAATPADRESLQWQRLQLLDAPEHAARAESARRQLADAAFGDAARLSRVVEEFRRAGAMQNCCPC
ncbi:MAG UNVERIFIED_CONTAM: tetratricopeptide repeat protein [Planctomycetaceae bacterium]